MENSRDFNKKCELYRSEGWNVTEDGVATLVTKFSHKTIRIADDNKYDGWHKLPSCAEAYDEETKYCLDINAKIAAGEIPSRISGSVPSAWIDYSGLAKNKAIYKAAYAAAKKELENTGSLYRRLGSRFVKAFA